MDNLSGKDLLRFFKTVDIDADHIPSESVDWFFYKPELKNILTWLCRYVNEDNILTASDIYEQEILTRNQIELYDGDRLDQKIQEVNDTYPGIFEITQNEINHLKKDLERELEKEKTIDKLTTNYLNLDYKQQQKLTKLTNEDINTKAQRDTVANECVDVSKKIDEALRHTQNNMKRKLDVLQNYRYNLDEKYFIFQMPLETYRSREENFYLYLCAYIAEEFDNNKDLNCSVENSNRSMSESTLIGQEYYRLYKNMQNSIIGRTVSEYKIVELQTRLQFLRENLHRKSYDNKRVKLLQFKVNAKIQKFEALCITELKEAAEKYSRNLINNVLYLVIKKKLECCRKTIEKLQVLYEEIRRVISFNALLDNFYRWEEQQIESILKYLSQSHYYLMNYQKNLLDKELVMNEMENDHKKYMETPIEQKHRLISDILKVVTRSRDDTTVSDALKTVRQRKMNIGRLKHELFTTEKQKYKKILKDLDGKIKEIRHDLESGPTMQPVIIPYSFIQMMFKSMDSLQKVTDKLNVSMKKFKETEASLSNEWLRNKQLLYVWFLTSPNKLLSVIQQLEDHLYSQNNPESKLIDI